MTNTDPQDIFASLNVSKILVAILEIQKEIVIPSNLFLNAATIDKELQVDYNSDNQTFVFKLREKESNDN
jgi:hypothetical protein